VTSETEDIYNYFSPLCSA